jgi:cytochrome c
MHHHHLRSAHTHLCHLLKLASCSLALALPMLAHSAETTTTAAAATTTAAAKQAKPSTPTSTAMTTTPIAGARFLVFSKTAGWRHSSIPAGIEALQALADKHKFSITASEDAALFTDTELRKYNAIVFLSTSGNILDEHQQAAMERFIRAGGGFVGIHSATDTERPTDQSSGWPWYGQLVGAVFKNHPNAPNVIEATINVTDAKHPATENMPATMSLRDEWYNFSSISSDNKVLVTVDEKSYEGGEHGALHPISWYREFDGGRSFYTALGHTIDQFELTEFLDHLLGGMRYAVGANNATPGKPALK